MLTKNARTHKAIFKDGRQINLTTQQYQQLRIKREAGRKNEIVTIKNPDSQETLFDGEIGEIREFSELNTNTTPRKYVCEHGTRHFLHEKCDCTNKFKCSHWTFVEWLIDRKYKVFYASDITSKMQNEFLEMLSKNNIRWYKKGDVKFNSDLL